MILPVLLVVSQLYMQKMMTPPTDDPQQASMQSVMKFMPLMFGYFALVVPAGLSLYWFTSNILAMAQQYFTKTSSNPAPAPTEAMVATTPAGTTNPVSTEVQEAKEENKQKNVKSKRRKSRRKR
jgi:YidC/Oxa1 family membrane protein insertase